MVKKSLKINKKNNLKGTKRNSKGGSKKKSQKGGSRKNKSLRRNKVIKKEQTQIGGIVPDKCVYKNIMPKAPSSGSFLGSKKDRLIKLYYSGSEKQYYIKYMEPSYDYGNEKELRKIYPVDYTNICDGHCKLTIISRSPNPNDTSLPLGNKPNLTLMEEDSKTEADKWGSWTQRHKEWVEILKLVIAYNLSAGEEAKDRESKRTAVTKKIRMTEYNSFGTPSEEEIESCLKEGNNDKKKRCFLLSANESVASPLKCRPDLVPEWHYKQERDEDHLFYLGLREVMELNKAETKCKGRKTEFKNSDRKGMKKKEMEKINAIVDTIPVSGGSNSD